MKKILGFILLLSSAMLGGAQTTTVSATVVDTDGTTWANGSWSLQFVPNPANPNPAVYNINGTPLNPAITSQSGSMNGSGALSFNAYQNGVITPIGSGWKLTVCPNAITQCGSYNFTAAGASMSLSSALTPVIPAPRFIPVSGTFGYSDIEAIIQLRPGSTYWNVTSSDQRCYTGSSWVGCGGSGTGCPLTGCTMTGFINYNILCSGITGSYCPPVDALLPPNTVYARYIAGVDCTGMTNSAPALNAVTSVANSISHRKLTFAGCPLVRVDSQWLIYGQSGAEIDLGARLIDGSNEGSLGTYSNATGTEIFGCNGSAVAVIRVADTQHSDFHGGLVSSSPGGTVGTCTSSNFTGAIETINSTAGGTGSGWTPTHNHFHDMVLVPSYNGLQITNWKGFSILDGPNQEMYRLDNLFIRCSYGISSIGFYSNDNNADSTHIGHGTEIENCKWGVYMAGGVVYVEDSNLTGSGYRGYFQVAGGATFFEAGGTVAEVKNTVSGDNSGQVLGNDGANGRGFHNWQNNQFNISGIANTVYAIDIMSGNSNIFINNQFLANGNPPLNNTIFGSLPSDTNNVNGSGHASLITVGNSTDTTYLTGVQYPDPLPWQLGEQHDEFVYSNLYTPIAVSGAAKDDSFDTILHSTTAQFGSVGSRSPFHAYQVWNTSIPATSSDMFFTYGAPKQAGGNDAAFVIEHRGDSTNPLMIIQPKIVGAAQTAPALPPTAVTVNARGTTGATDWAYYATCVTGNNIETTQSATFTIHNGNAVLNGSNYNRIGIDPLGLGSGCFAYRFYRAIAAGTPNTTGFIGQINLSQIPSNYGQLATLDDTGLAATGVSPPSNNYADGVLISNRFQNVPIPFASAQLCNATTEGSTQAFTDSNTNVWGANIANGGANHILGYCNGTNWTVAAK